MDKEKLKVMIRNLELMIDNIKAEVYSDVDAYNVGLNPDSRADYDELYDDDDGYTD